MYDFTKKSRNFLCNGIYVIAEYFSNSFRHLMVQTDLCIYNDTYLLKINWCKYDYFYKLESLLVTEIKLDRKNINLILVTLYSWLPKKKIKTKNANMTILTNWKFCWLWWFSFDQKKWINLNFSVDWRPSKSCFNVSYDYIPVVNKCPRLSSRIGLM